MLPQGDVYTNADGTYIADLALDDGELRVYASESPTTPLQPARGDAGRPLVHMRVVPPPSSPSRPAYPWRLNITMRMNLTSEPVSTTAEHPLAGTIPRVTYLGRMVSSGTWSYDGTEFFVVWMDGLISRVVVHPQVRVCVCVYPQTCLFFPKDLEFCRNSCTFERFRPPEAQIRTFQFFGPASGTCRQL